MKLETPILISVKQEEDLRGGNIYLNYLIDFLKKNYQAQTLSISGCSSGPMRRWRYYRQSKKKSFQTSLIIEDIVSLCSRPLPLKHKTILLLHNIPEKRLQDKLFGSFLLHKLKARLDHCHAIVVVSEFYRKKLQQWTKAPIHVIHNPFDLNLYTKQVFDPLAFKAKWNLDDRPILYFGSVRRGKGLETCIPLLKNHPWQCVTSGAQEFSCGSHHLNLTFQDYLKLLQLSNVAIAFPDEPEGWPRMMHEALLMETPLIGYPTAGLGELLHLSQQKVCSTLSDLPLFIQQILHDPKPFKPESLKFAREFDLKRFQQGWSKLIEQSLGSILAA